MMKKVRRKLFKRSGHRRDSRLGSILKTFGLKPSRERMDLDCFSIMYCQNRYGKISLWFLFYKYIHAFVMVSYLVLNVSHMNYFEPNENLLWHMYVNHWSSVVSCLEAFCGVFVVSYFLHHCRTKAMRDQMNISDNAYNRLLFYVYLNATSITFSAASSFLFFVFICDHNYLTVPKMLEHGSMPAFLLLKLIIERVPFEIPFVIYPSILLTCYFGHVTIVYYAVYKNDPSKQLTDMYILKHFNTEKPLYFFWFSIQSILIQSAIHVLLVVVFVSKRLVIRVLCRKRKRKPRRWGSPGRDSRTGKRHSYTPSKKLKNWLSITDSNIIASPMSTSKNPFRRMIDIIGYLETQHRQDYMHPEWRHYSADHPSGFYLLYRFFHMALFILMIMFPWFELNSILMKPQAVKYIILWIFYFGNFFLVVSLFQSLFGFVVIYRAFRRDVTQLLYYQKSDSYVTGFQKAYSAIHSTATTLAIFAFATSWQLVEDTHGSFELLDYSYDSSHIINPLAMLLDFLVVGHPFKFLYLILTLGILGMNFVFNHWLYSSKITSRSGKKLVYEYLNWDDNSKALINMLILTIEMFCIHCVLWLIFLAKRYYGVALNRRRVLGYQVDTDHERMTVSSPSPDRAKEPPVNIVVAIISEEPKAGTSNPKKNERKKEPNPTDLESLNSDASFQIIGRRSTTSVRLRDTSVTSSKSRLSVKNSKQSMSDVSRNFPIKPSPETSAPEKRDSVQTIDAKRETSPVDDGTLQKEYISPGASPELDHRSHDSDIPPKDVEKTHSVTEEKKSVGGSTSLSLNKDISTARVGVDEDTAAERSKTIMSFSSNDVPRLESPIDGPNKSRNSSPVPNKAQEVRLSPDKLPLVSEEPLPVVADRSKPFQHSLNPPELKTQSVSESLPEHRLPSLKSLKARLSSSNVAAREESKPKTPTADQEKS